MQLAIVAAGFTPGEADQLRRAMAAWKRKGGLGHFEERLIRGMRERGYAEEFAQADLPADPGLRRVRLPGVARGELRAAGVRLGVAQAPRAGGVRRGAHQQPADGLLRAVAARAGRAPPRRRGAAGGCAGERLGLHARAAARTASRRCGSGCGSARASREAAALRLRRGARRRRSSRACRISPSARGSTVASSAASPRRARWRASRGTVTVRRGTWRESSRRCR